MRFKLKCNFCAEVFVHIGADYPDSCPHCGAYIGLDGKPEVALPAISLAKNRGPDRTYKALEESAKGRIEQAAAMTGEPESSFNDMKVTDMKDRLRPGDISAPAVRKVPGVDLNASFGGTVPQEHQQAIAGVKSGPMPNAGASQIGNIRSFHQKYSQHMVAASREGSARVKV